MGAVVKRWFPRLTQITLLVAIIAVGLTNGQAVSAGGFVWWSYPALLGLFIAAFAANHALDHD